LTIDGHNYGIPHKTIIFPNPPALHTHPRYWGKDSPEWRPSRWVESSKSGANIEAVLQTESVIKPIRGLYIPWLDGAWVCPGKKFAQVEFIAVMSALFREHGFHVVLGNGESLEEARSCTLKAVENIEMEIMLKMKNPGRVSVRLAKVC
jgi:cytochrome P450